MADRPSDGCRRRRYLRKALLGLEGDCPGHTPAGFVATDPTSPGYNWAGMDPILEAADAAGLTPILDIGAPPTGRGRQRRRA